MSEKKSISIRKDEEKPISLDYKSLRQQAIKLVQQLSGHIWTDYNIHDPGVTILEMLCLAITDLAYRTDFPIQDLLADKNGNIPSIENAFFSKEDILTTNPVTINDYRKAIQDEIADVYNIWLEPVLSKYAYDSVKGLYKIYVQMTKEAAGRINDNKNSEESDIREQIKEQIRNSFTSKRNVGEDWVREVIILNPLKITIEADVIITGKTDPEEILADLYCKLEDYLNPPVRYYSEMELLKEGFNIEDIYAGPILKKGLIPDSKMAERRQIIDPDELVRKIMQVEEVIAIKNLIIQTPDGHSGRKPYQLNKLCFPYLKVDPQAPSIHLFKGKNRITIEADVFNDLFNRKKDMAQRNFLSSFHKTENKEQFKGTNKDLEHYYSIQNHFPGIYGISEEGLAPGSTTVRKAQARQLKAYLMLFEQLLANYLSQLVNSKNIFSIDLTNENHFTYYYQPLYDIPDVKDILKAFTERKQKEEEEKEWKKFKNNKNNPYIQSIKKALESDETYRKRKEQVFDHLLARFNIQLETYPVTLYHSLYGDHTVTKRVNPILEWKSDILNGLVSLSSERMKAIDYLDKSLTKRIVSGFTKKMTKLLYIHNERIRPLSWIFDLKKTPNKETTGIHSLVCHGSHQEYKHEGNTKEKDWRDSFDFGNQTTGIFKYGIDINNYKIIEDDGKDKGFQIMYIGPEKKERNIISRKFLSQSAVTLAIRELINHLKQISIESEGFHIVEHVLLRPPLEKAAYGFGFYKNKETLLFRNNRWVNFDEREKDIREIVHTEDSQDPSTFSSDKVYLPGEERNQEDILNHLRLNNERKTRFFPKFELWVKRANNSIIREDYFNLRISVVLPAWPARFQDDNFREFTEGLFRIHAPAHLKIHFFWLNIIEMKKFEKIYFEWLHSLNRQKNNMDNNELSDKLIALLNGEHYQVNHIN